MTGLFGGRGGQGLSFERPRRGATRRLIIAALVVIGLIAVGSFAYGQFAGGGCGDDQYCKSGRQIAAPPGYLMMSDIFVRREGAPEQPSGTTVRMKLPLRASTSDSGTLNVFRYDEASKTWEPVAVAVLDSQSKSVTALLQNTPEILAVLRRQSAAGYVVGYIPHDGGLHADAIGRLTILHTLDFTPTADGTLAGEPSGVPTEPGISWYPVISANSNNGANIFVEAILEAAATRSDHVQQIQRKVDDLGLHGIDIAYFDLPADRRGSFTLFATELAQSLHSTGKVLTLTLPCPLRAQDRVDEGAYDWGALGQAADVIKMAPCRDQSSLRRDLPVILEHLTGVVPPSKLVLSVTPYASEKSVDGIRTLSLAEAMTIALAVNVASAEDLVTNSNVSIVGTNIDRTENLTGITWDTSAANVAFTYKLNGGRTVWIENVFSIGFKLEFVGQFDLGGLAVENASDDVYLGNIWPALVPYIASGQPVLSQPNGVDLIPQWHVSSGQLEEGPPGQGVVTWLTPAEPGSYTIRLTLSDGVAQFERELTVTVTQPETLDSQSDGN